MPQARARGTNQLAVAGGGFVREDLAVADMHNAMRKLRDISFVRHEHDGIALGVQMVEERHDLLAGLGVEIAGRLIGEDDRRMIDQGTGDGYALALAAKSSLGLCIMRDSSPTSVRVCRARARRSAAGVPL